MFGEVLRIRWYSMTGAYNAGAVPAPEKL
jgi:hypothetical protein